MLIIAESAEIILLLFTSNLVEIPHNCGGKKLMPNTEFVYIYLLFDNLTVKTPIISNQRADAIFGA